MLDLDLLIDFAVSSGEIESGVPCDIVRNRSSLPLAYMPAPGIFRKAPRWTDDENEFLRRNLGYIEESQIAGALGRSSLAIHLRWSRDLHLPAPSKHPDYLTAQQIAKRLGQDTHKVCAWLDRGLLPGEILPGGRRIRRVRKVTLLRWLLTPANWIWFDIEHVRDPKMRRLLELKRHRWGDEWWTTRRVAFYHGVDVGDVKRYIKLGRIKAVRAPNIGGRDNGYWAFWFVLRSEATRPDLVFQRGSGSGHDLAIWSERCDAFLLLARAVGLPVRNIATLMRWDYKRVDYRLRTLHRSGRIPDIIASQRLEIAYRPEDGALFANWRNYRERFPFLANAIDEFQSYLSGGKSSYPNVFRPGDNHPQLLMVRGVLQTWMTWYARDESSRDLAYRLHYTVHSRPEKLAEAWADLQGLLEHA